MIEKTRQLRGSTLAIGCVVILLSAFFCGCGPDKEDAILRDLEASAKLTEGAGCIANHQHAEGVALCKEVIAIRPDDDAAYANMAVGYMGLGQYDAAVEACKKAIALNPDAAGARSNMAVIYRRMGQSHNALGQYAQAVTACKASIAIDPDNPSAYYSIGVAYEKLKDSTLAIKAYQKVLAISNFDEQVFPAAEIAIRRIRSGPRFEPTLEPTSQPASAGITVCGLSDAESERVIAGLGAKDLKTRAKSVELIASHGRSLCQRKDRDALHLLAKRCADSLKEAVYDENLPMPVRITAVKGMSYFGPVNCAVYRFFEDAFDVKMRSIENWGDPDPSLAVISLGDTAAQFFAETLQYRDAKLRRQAAMYLGQFRSLDKQVGDALFKALYDVDEFVRAEAAGALGQTARHRGKLPLETGKVVRRLINMGTTETHGAPLGAAILALGNIGPAARIAIPVLEKQLEEHPGSIVVGYALARIDPKSEKGLDCLIRAVKGNDIDACIILGQVGPSASRAIPAVRKYIKAPHDWMRKVKQETLANIAGPR
jgi:tetratricopeptide (TPR) repeat protein